MITEDYVSFEVAKLLKEKGFDIPVQYEYHFVQDINQKPQFHRHLHNFNGEEYDRLHSKWYSAPTLQMAYKWLEIKKHIAIIPILSSVLDNEKFLWHVKIVIAETGEKYSQGWVYENREQACEAALKYALENLI